MYEVAWADCILIFQQFTIFKVNVKLMRLGKEIEGCVGRLRNI